jgi:hypothetical protein
VPLFSDKICHYCVQQVPFDNESLMMVVLNLHLDLKNISGSREIFFSWFNFFLVVLGEFFFFLLDVLFVFVVNKDVYKVFWVKIGEK